MERGAADWRQRFSKATSLYQGTRLGILVTTKAAAPIRLFAAIMVANILTMLVMNVFGLANGFFLVVYGASLVGALFLLRSTPVESVENREVVITDRERRWLIGGFVALLALYVLPRSSYLFEGLFGYSMDAVCWDDYWHIQELNSLINSPSYPAVSSFRAGQYLSHYYGAWMFLVFLYKLLPFGFMTIKVVMFLGKAIYTLLILYTVGYFAYGVSRSKRQFYFLLYLIVAYSGAHSLLVFIQPLRSHKWWMLDLARVRIQISDFSDLSLWVTHHLVAAMSLIIAYWFYTQMRTRTKGRPAYRVMIALLLVSSFYSSVFVFIGGSLFIAYIYLRDIRTEAKDLLWIGLASFLLGLPILWLYLKKRVGFQVLDTVRDWSTAMIGHRLYAIDLLLSFLLFLVLMLVQFVVQAFVLRKTAGELWRSRSEGFVLVVLSLSYLLSTFFILFANGNDYAMRGAILPVIMLAYVVSSYADRMPWNRGVCVILAILSLGSLSEIFIFQKANIRNLLLPPPSVELRKEIYRYNTDRSLHVVDAPAFARSLADSGGFSFYVTEKIVTGGHPKLWEPDSEIIHSGPFGIWNY
jgi:hypothetical protein